MNPILIEVGPFTITWYALFIVTGIAIGYYFMIRLFEKAGIDRDQFDYAGVVGVILGIIGARIYYVLFNLEYYLDNLNEIIRIDQGGLAIHGGIIAGFIWAFYYTNKHKINKFYVADCLALAFMIAQAIGRWGNFVNKEAYGAATTREFLEKLYLPEFIIEGMNIAGIYYQPTFLYESIWNVIGFIIGYFVIFKSKLKRGSTFVFYLVWYSIGRIFIESLRTDSLYLGEIRIAQLISVVMIILGIAVFLYLNFFQKQNDVKMIVATTIVVKNDTILLIKKNQGSYKYGMPGGKSEYLEIPIKTAAREFAEETGLNFLKLKLKVISEVKMPNRNYQMYTFLAEKYSGEAFKDNAEGKLEWVKINELQNIDVYEGDLEIINFALNNDGILKMEHEYDENRNLVGSKRL